MNRCRKAARTALFSMTLLLSICFPAGALAQENEPVVTITQVDISAFPEVVVYVSILDGNGQPVGVEPGQLLLTENSVRISPSAVEGIGEAEPITTLLLMDVSGSMNVDSKLEAAKAAAVSYVNSIRPIDRVGLIAFNTQVRVVQEFTSDREEVKAGIESLEGIYDTAMLDALSYGLDLLEKETGRKAVILLTDGLDTQSQSTLEELLGQLESQEVSVSTIGVGSRGQDLSVMSALDENTLQQLADAGGGAYSFAADESMLQEIYDRSSRALQSEYVIHYQSPSLLRDGVNRLIEVSLAASTSVIGDSGAVYNPGGVVPEIAGMPSWGMFAGFLAPLVVLLFLPGVVGIAKRIISGKDGEEEKRGGVVRLH